MKYKWEEECLKKYGEEATRKLVMEQQKYEEKQKDNDCEGCGKGNKGTLTEVVEGKPFLMRYGMWSNGRCEYCGRHEN
ncbi:hypothetical protein FHR92_002967 [Fontibacillus solani]|uniref:Uncharacterized protein n=1 Tax=Fontibacillus solani TaxID=1572857 RepID=A0A7W3SUR3_9BACL|nr:hypothetical protein [Fontibacillus solani]MBA9086489.1 hypothetical protein [Fontibacillus solani]